jgi:hypothetical protein
MVTDDPLLEELTQEAERRGVEVQQHIYDLLRGRYLLRRGESLTTLLWLPGEVPAAAPTEPECPDVTARPARDAATAWVELLGTADA